MNLPRSFFIISSCLAILLVKSTFFYVEASTQTKIQVSLLGESCTLEGPFNKATLTAIHAIGPAQIYPTLSSPNIPGEKAKLQKAVKSLEKMKGSSELPSELERYRSKLVKRFDEQIAFFDAVETFRKTSKTESLLKVGQEKMSENKVPAYKNTLKKLENSNRATSQEKETIEKLFDLYSDAIEPDPESEFHKTIKRINVQYNCSFEESDQ